MTKSEMLTEIESALDYVLLGKEMSLEQRVQLICERIEELTAVARLPVQAPPPTQAADSAQARPCGVGVERIKTC